MVAGFQLLCLLLVSFLSELDYCSAFPRARRSAYPEAWQGVREEQNAHGFGNPQFVQSLMQSNPKIQSNDQVNSWPRAWGPSWTDNSQGQMQYQPHLYNQPQTMNQPWSAISSQPQSQVPVPKSFHLNVHVPMVNAQTQNRENGSSTKVSSSGGSDHASYNPRPSSVQIQSSFNSPPVLDRFLGTGRKKPHGVSKPSFEFSLSVPISSTTPSSNPSTSSSKHPKPERGHFAENGDEEPESVQRPMEQISQLVNSEHADRKVITFSPEQASKLPIPSEQISQGEIPSKHTWFFPDQTQYPAFPVQSWQPENIFSGYYSGQINPSVYHYWRDQSGQMVSPSPNNAHLAPWQYVVPIGPSGNYGPYRICYPDGTPVTFAEQYGQVIPTYDWHKVPVRSQRPGPRSYAPLSHEHKRPSFDYWEDSARANYQMGNVMPRVQDYPHQYHLGHSLQDADSPTAFGSSQNVQGGSIKYETQMGRQVAPNPVYHGQYKYFF